jgi:hypothetical protein
MGSLQKYIESQSAVALTANGFQKWDARRPMAPTLLLKQIGVRHVPRQLKNKLPQSRIDAKRGDGSFAQSVRWNVWPRFFHTNPDPKTKVSESS